jgi:hypothetical protein
MLTLADLTSRTGLDVLRHLERAAAIPVIAGLQGERGFALMSQRWRALQRVMVSPTTIGDITKSVLVLVQFEHKMIS